MGEIASSPRTMWMLCRLPSIDAATLQTLSGAAAEAWSDLESWESRSAVLSRALEVPAARA